MSLPTVVSIYTLMADSLSITTSQVQGKGEAYGKELNQKGEIDAF